ncbi:PSP1 domain-containing protein [Thermocrinis minervae]|uniref:Cell fate regulator YaaT, PSP1 superfamily (Controls sporulation, competence, biofilm development) n=1 Tax=Thermocrinis minervae TaxID=381751 RepID=A0A1M6R4I1_9AQUI|nr:regulatory iron-sulfur-containing complex subunit RicT [Thermocrinis minervae]SHK27379.1 Cell fate regulator YaaT, PSP1 superfamily (controls sporulation, competence, biofilm development) [Thermocrinis minervae]
MHVKARFLDTRKILEVENAQDVKKGDLVVVLSDRGQELIQILGVSKEESQLKALFLRKADEEDLRIAKENEKLAEDALVVCKEKVQELGLDMKPIKTYIPLDRSKYFFYYLSEKKVDFRELVRALARVFKKRIEMRQVGVRDAIQMMGWIGPCGEMACCYRFIENFESISLRDIEEQNLPLSPTKFTGLCGRLMCCLAFERENYLVKNILPEVGSEICLNGKVYKILHIDPPHGKSILELDGKRIEIPLESLLPNDYKVAIENCKRCSSCCRRNLKEDEVAL